MIVACPKINNEDVCRVQVALRERMIWDCSAVRLRVMIGQRINFLCLEEFDYSDAFPQTRCASQSRTVLFEKQ